VKEFPAPPPLPEAEALKKPEAAISPADPAATEKLNRI
jgi:hypothetical protein